MLDGVKPRAAPLVLRRVIVNGVPDFMGGAGRLREAGRDGFPARGCRPVASSISTPRPPAAA